MQITCGHCGYSWNTESKAARISCSKCKTSIRVHHTHEPKPVVEPVIVVQPPKHEEVFIPRPLADQLNKFLLARLIGIAKGEGENRIRFKVNDQGELYLP